MASTGNRSYGGAEPHSGQQTGRTAMPGGATQTPRPDEGSSGGVLGAVKEKAQDLASSVGEAWESTKHGAQRAASAVADTAGDTWNEVTGFLRRYPVATFCAGIGLGFLLAQLFRGRGTSMFGGWGWESSYNSYPSDYRGSSAPERGRPYPYNAGP